VDIVVKGRNVEVPDHYRVHVADKLSRVKRYDHKAIRYDVELFHERNPRQSKICQRVEITGRCRGQLVRAEACGPDFYAALDVAVSKLENRLRRAADRRKVHHGRRHPTSVAEATAPLAAVLAAGATSGHNGQYSPTRVLDHPNQEFDAPEYHVPAQRTESPEVTEPGRIVGHKKHPAEPMTVDQALYEMELVGHDFYLFSDADSGRASVVYRKRGFHYGVIQLI
jgi:ribosomal subunit interface protein